MSKNLQKYIKKCKKLIDYPYNKFNLDNYISILKKEFKCEVFEYDTSKTGAIQLMGGYHKNCKIVSTHKAIKRSDIVLVGKGILFDAGGYNLKDKMADMKIDMSGLATSFAVASYFKNELKKENVIAYCPVSTNFIHNNKIIPGDYLKIKDKIVEITDTDAEGRLILAEALSNLENYKDNVIFTIATLTGMVGYAIGDKATGVFSPNNKLAQKYLDSADSVKELAWRLPLWDYLQKKFKTKKIKNWEKTKPGATMGAMFIKQFVPNLNKWIHLDIAYSTFDEEKQKATGEPVKSLVDFIQRYNG